MQTVDSILVDSTPGFLDSIRLTEFTLGTKAPRVESIKTYPKSESDLVMMDWRVTFAPTDIEDMTPRQLRTQINPKIVLTIRVGKGIVGAGMPILVEDMSFSGIMRIKLKLTSNFPHIKMFDFSFLETPTIDYVLKPVGGDTFGMDIAHVSKKNLSMSATFNPVLELFSRLTRLLFLLCIRSQAFSRLFVIRLTPSWDP